MLRVKLAGAMSMQRYLRGATVATALLVTLCAAAGARAEPASDAMAAAKRLYLQGYFERAQRAFGAIAQRVDLPRARRATARLYVGLCLHGRERPADAREAFRRALELDGALRLSAQRFKPEVVALFEKVRRSLRGQLVLQAKGQPAGMTLLVDGDRISPAKARGPLTLRIGEHVVELRDRAGQTVKQLVVVVRPGRTTRVALPAFAPRAAATAGGRRADLVARPTPARSRWRRPWPWAVAGLSVALAGVGVGLGASVVSDHQRWKTLDRSSSEARSLRASGQKKMIAANVLVGSAVVAAITAVALFLRRASR